MASPFRYVNTLGNLLAQSIQFRSLYRGWYDVGKAAWLRIGSTALARQILLQTEKRRTLRISASQEAFHLRTANSDFHVWCEIFEKAEYEPVLKMGLPSDAVILDLGANIGLAARYFSIHFPQCKIVAVEPDAGNCDMIRLNGRRMLDEHRLHVVQGFVAAQDGQASIAREGDSWAYHKVEPVGIERIACHSVQKLCHDYGISRIDLFKCDIEGTEVELFAQCAAWIGRVRHMVIEVHRPYRLSDLYAALRLGGWRFRAISEAPDRLAFLSAIGEGGT